MICDWCGRDIWPNESHFALIETPAGLRRERICDECDGDVSDPDPEDDYGDLDYAYEDPA